LHAAVAQEVKNAQTTWVSEHFWKLRCRKSPRLRSKCTKHRRCGALLAVEPSRSKSRCHFGAKHMSKSKSRMHLSSGALLEGALFEVRMRFGLAGAYGFCTFSKVSQMCGFDWVCSSFKNDGRRGTFEEDVSGCMYCDRCSTSYDLASLFRGRCNTLIRWNEKSQNALVRGRQLCTRL
jgi:hypothetical protein